MRLIDASKLREAMYHEAFETDSDMQKWDSGCWIRYKMFENNLDNAPTVDAEPVKHGRWEWSEDNWWHRCTACGVTFDYDKTYELFDHGFQLANYCPNCGARMDGKE